MKIFSLKNLPCAAFVQGFERARRNCSWSSRDLCCGGVTYAEGIGLFMQGHLTLDLHGNCETLFCRVALDDYTPAKCAGIFRFLDAETGKMLKEVKVDFHKKPEECKISLAGIHQFSIEYFPEEKNVLLAFDLLALNITYRGTPPCPTAPVQMAETRDLHWLFAPMEPGVPLRQFGLFRKVQGKIAGAELTAWNTFPQRGGHPDYHNLPFNLKITSSSGIPCVKLDECRTEHKGDETVFIQRDEVLLFEHEFHIQSFFDEDIFKVWCVIRNKGKEAVTLADRDAVNVSVPVEKRPLVRRFRGSQLGEMQRIEDVKLPHGTLMDHHYAVSHNGQEIFAGTFIGIEGTLSESRGTVLGCAFGWDGNWQTRLTYTEKEEICWAAGSAPEPFVLDPGASYTTPAALVTMGEGTAQVTQNFHRYFRRIARLHTPAPVVLNSWEGCVFDFDEAKVKTLIRSAAQMGVELFVLDDGWFGNGKFVRDNSAGLGDWQCNREKLPGGLEALIAEAEKNHIQFGIWVEPEMVNTKSLLYEKHPEWVMTIPGRELLFGRGGTQLMLDLANPEVEKFVYDQVANLLSSHPGIAYIKWDHNARARNSGSLYLKERMSELSERHNQAFLRIIAKLRKNFPSVRFQLCASGGGRSDVGTLHFFDEFWCSDNSQGWFRITTQWGQSHFFPPEMLASHVSSHADVPSPYKFRCDVAMSARMGIELVPSRLGAADQETLKRAVAAYKEVRPLLHSGMLFRGRDPRKSMVTEHTVVSEDRSQAVLFGFKRSLESCRVRICPQGLDPKAVYRMTEINPDRHKRCQGYTESGIVLMKDGIEIAFPAQAASVVIKLEKSKEL